MLRHRTFMVFVLVLIFQLASATDLQAQDQAGKGKGEPQTEYKDFLAVLGGISKLVLLSIILERGLAFIFEHDWFVGLTTREVPDPNDSTKKIRVSRIPGLKGVIALACATGLCFIYDFDLMAVIFGNKPPDPLGKVITAIVAAGGSAGAIAAFQGFLNWNKAAREAAVAARKAEAEAAKLAAEAAGAEANARREVAEAERAEAEARRRITEARSPR